MTTNITENLDHYKKLYAEVLIKIGVNLQPGESLYISTELAHREMISLITDAAYKAGARFVEVNWNFEPLTKSRLLNCNPEYLGFVPEYEIARHQQMVDEGWARLALTGDEFPDLLDDVDPGLIQTTRLARAKALKFYRKAQMGNEIAWCVAGIPTEAWASKALPELAEESIEAAVDELWAIILRASRVDQPDPVAAWQAHDDTLTTVTRFMAQKEIRSLRFLDEKPGPDGKPTTDLRIGLTDAPQWLAASAIKPDGTRFMPNMPTEETFTTPHNQRTDGWVRTSKPTFPIGRKVDGATFHFEAGELVDYSADIGADVLEKFFEISGTKRLGEVALVDNRSPINQTGRLFYDILFDENAVSHIAFGKAYPEGIVGGNGMSEDDLEEAGVNESDAHVDFMIGTRTMSVIGICADGSEVKIMQNGQFTTAVTGA